jgi:hypothetical protein
MDPFFIFGVFGPDGADAEALINQISKGRKYFLALTKADVVTQVCGGGGFF